MKLLTSLKNFTRLVFFFSLFFTLGSGLANAATAAPYLRQSAANHASGTASTYSLCLSNNTVAGDVILVGVDFAAGASLTSLSDSLGSAFTEVGTPLTSPGGAVSGVFYAKNIKAGRDMVNIQLSASSPYIEVYLAEYHNVSATSPIDAQAGAVGNAGTVSSGIALTSVASDVIYGYCVGDMACTVGSGFTARSTFDGNLMEDESAGKPGAYAAIGSANSGWTMQMVALRSTSGTGPNASFSPSSLTFAGQSVGAAGAAQTVTLTNSGNAALNITGIAPSGANASDFAQSNTCGTSVAAGANCTISVTFKPSAAGTRTAAITVTDNAPGGTQCVSLTGTGTAAAASVSPSSLTFANQTVGVASGAQTVTLSNSGNAALNITGIALSGANVGDFAQSNNCGTSVAAGANCTISVTFKPSAAGTRTAAITVTDNAPGGTQSVSLSGTGTTATPVASLSPSSLTFPSQTVGAASAAQTVTLTNSGNAALSITGIGPSGANAGDFAQSNNCGTSVAAGANCAISVTFKPSAAGTRTAAITVTDNASGGTQSASLTGTGSSGAPIVSFSPSSLSFGGESVMMTSTVQTVTMTNTGTATLNVSGLAVTGANPGDFAQAGNCGNSLAAGANCTIAVLFTPSASGSRTASISVSDNATGSPQTVSLSGSGTHDVIMSWVDSGSGGVMGYNIYRGTAAGGEGATPVNSAPVSNVNFTDQSVSAGATYYYVVMAVASDGSQSAASAETNATVPSN